MQTGSVLAIISFFLYWAPAVVNAADADRAIVTNSEEDQSRRQSWKTCVDMLYPAGSRSALDLQQQIQTPHDIRQLLENVRLAWEQNLLVQPPFFQDVTLQKFFAGSSITWKAPVDFYGHDEKIIQGQLVSSLLPGMTVSIESRCSRIDNGTGSTHLDSSAYLVGSVQISGGPFPGMSVRTIREVLGAETRVEPDTVTIEFGIVHPPT
jgi:hypothetical protein